MNLLICSPQVDRDESELLQVTRHHNVQIVRTPEELISRLSQPPGDHGVQIVILLVSGMAELEKFIEAREYLSNKALILILPEEESVLVSMGFRLSARYMGFRGGAFEDVAAVIARIQTRIARTQNIRDGSFKED
ncbi:MAG: hypothetical protein NT047_09170 [Deltaproteobacteria bacterium]|nr:hypothetical protein [Deltaproteobacteria bacterium]